MSLLPAVACATHSRNRHAGHYMSGRQESRRPGTSRRAARRFRTARLPVVTGCVDAGWTPHLLQPPGRVKRLFTSKLQVTGSLGTAPVQA
jgi:hypothetical protein